MDHVLRLYANPLKQVVYLPFSLFFVVVGLALIHSAKPTPVGLYVLALGCLSVAFFGLGSCVLLVSIGHSLLRPRPVLQVDAQGWTYAPAGLDWTQHAAWQEVSRIALQRQHIRSKRRFLLVLEEERRGDAAQSDAGTSATNPSPPSSAVVMFVELDSIFPYATPGRLMRVLERIRTEFAAELDRYGITGATTIVDI